MDVKVSNYGQGEVNFVEYSVSGLTDEQLNYLNDNLEEKTMIKNGKLVIVMNFDDKLYPFGSDVAKLRLNDFISREEIEMNIFLLSFLEDM